MTQFVDVDLNPGATQDRQRQQVATPDPFADEQFAPLDLRQAPLAEQLADLANANPELAPPPPPDLPGQDEIDQQPAPPAVHEPEVIQYDDGSALTITKNSRGWEAVLDSGSGNPEVFRGKTKDEMWTNIAAAKMHATRHIRDLNKKIKLTVRNEAPAQPQQPQVGPQQVQNRALTADEVVEIKNQLGVNPDLALDAYFQKKTGLSINQLVALARQGANEAHASRSTLDMEAIAKEFTGSHPEYQSTNENYFALIGWLTKYKLGRTLTKRNTDEMMDLLYESGHFTVDSLDEAYEELVQDGFLELASQEQEEEEEPEPPAPPPTPNPRIARVRVGPRAGLGIRTRETTAAAREPVTNRPPSAEELDNLSDAEIAQLFSGVRRVASQSARR